MPGRTSDSLRNLLKVHFKNGHDYDSYFQQNIKSMRFSHFFQEIPKPNAKLMRELTNQEALYIKTAPPKLINAAPSSGLQIRFNNSGLSGGQNSLDNMMAGGRTGPLTGAMSMRSGASGPAGSLSLGDLAANKGG